MQSLTSEVAMVVCAFVLWIRVLEAAARRKIPDASTRCTRIPVFCPMNMINTRGQDKRILSQWKATHEITDNANVSAACDCDSLQAKNQDNRNHSKFHFVFLSP